MDKLLEILESYANLTPMHENCHIKIRRAEVAAIQAYTKGKVEGQRELAIRLLEVINGTH